MYAVHGVHLGRLHRTMAEKTLYRASPCIVKGKLPRSAANAVLWQRIQKNVAAVGTCLSPKHDHHFT